MEQKTMTEETKQEVKDKILAVFREYNLNFGDIIGILRDLRCEVLNKAYRECF